MDKSDWPRDLKAGICPVCGTKFESVSRNKRYCSSKCKKVANTGEHEMPGTLRGGKKAADTNKQLYGEDFYKRIGAMGGHISAGGGFGSETIGKDGLTGYQRASIAGSKGGKVSRRTKKPEPEHQPVHHARFKLFRRGQ